jgi:hypothetical protein
VLGLLIPVAAAFAVAPFGSTAFRGSRRRFDVAMFVALIVLLVIASALAGRMLIYDSREWFVRWVLTRFVSEFPTPTLDAMKAFGRFPTESWFTGALMLSWFGALAFATARLCRLVFRHDAGGGEDERDDLIGQELILAASMFGGLVVLVSQVGVGLFQFAANSRQFAGFLISGVTLATLLLTGGSPWIRAAVPVAAAGLLGLYWYTLQQPRSAYEIRYAQVVRCLDEKFPAGADFAGDFWLKVPIEFWSDGRFRGVTSTPSRLPAFTNGQNVVRMRTVRPTLAIAAADEHRQFLDAYGAPARTLVCPWGVVALDYSNNPAFTERHSAAAKAAQ